MKANEAKEITVKAQANQKAKALEELPRIYERIKTAAEAGKTSVAYYAPLHDAVVEALRAQDYLVTVNRTVEGPFTPSNAKALTTTISWGLTPDWDSILTRNNK